MCNSKLNKVVSVIWRYIFKTLTIVSLGFFCQEISDQITEYLKAQLIKVVWYDNVILNKKFTHAGHIKFDLNEFDQISFRADCQQIIYSYDTLVFLTFLASGLAPVDSIIRYKLAFIILIDKVTILQYLISISQKYFST